MSRSAEADVIVVGAGVIGMCTALELAKRGLRVTVLERGEPGRESSWAGAGILAPLRPWHYPQEVWELCRESMALYPALVAELHELSGFDPEFLRCGARLYDPADHELAIQWHADEGLPCHEEAFGRHKWLRMPWVPQIRNPRLMKALVVALDSREVRIRRHFEVQRLSAGEGGIAGVEGMDHDRGLPERLVAREVVIAAGAWSRAICAEAPPVSPIRGQMLLVRPRHELPAGVWLLPQGYVVVRRDGLCLVGATVEHVGYDIGITREAREELLAAVTLLDDALVHARVLQQWCGLRPGITDGIPRCGPDPNRRGLWWHTGHFRNGLAMAPASAVRLANAITRCPARS